jgi:hypothetical protein
MSATDIPEFGVAVFLSLMKWIVWTSEAGNRSNVCLSRLNDASWIARHDRARRHVFRHHAPGTNHGIFADGNSAQQGHAGTD